MPVFMAHPGTQGAWLQQTCPTLLPPVFAKTGSLWQQDMRLGLQEDVVRNANGACVLPFSSGVVLSIEEAQGTGSRWACA